ncbi:hypothetical protein [Noviherbaspirillum saxi]|uniref:Phage gp6-like head-tail connector protein n=1 Tax=Noviherbaspirillum saxi TaxID=2320863 RepID=A0A3A3GDN8_9BURK|nr:hypothetical protein [Noviherbaspirillum saxi]RJF99019.1 hypothetical protein D3871_11240 [Noviherbaspirillum saxi]
MTAVLVSWADANEPVTLADVAAQCRIDADDAEAEKDLIEKLIIPGARQLAETRSGAAIRKGTYREILRSFPEDEFPLSKGQATEVTSLKCGGAVVNPTTYQLINLGKESLLSPSASWPASGTVEIEYEAGIDLEEYPSVKQWILMACAWAYSQRGLLLTGQKVEEMPSSYVDSLLDPICTPPRF